MMRPVLYFTAAIPLFLAVLLTGCDEDGASSSGVSPTAGATISFSTLEHDYGLIWDIASQTAAFPFRNTGDATLVITGVKPGCGCTTTTLPRTTFAPGEGDQIAVSFTPSGSGAQRKKITVTTNDPNNPITELYIKATVRPFVEFEPRIIQFGEVTRGLRNRTRVTLRPVDPDFEILSMWSTGDAARWLSASLLQDALPGTQRIEITLEETTPWGAVYAQLHVKGRGRTEPGGPLVEHTAKAYVNASVFGTLRADDFLFRVGTLSPRSPFRKVMRLTRIDGQPFRVLSARIEGSTLPGMNVQAVPVLEPGTSAVDLVLSGNTGSHTGPALGRVVVQTDVLGEESLTFRISLAVPSRQG